MIIFVLSSFVLLGGVVTSIQGQILPQNNNSSPAISTTPGVKNLYGIRITEPTNGQQFLINGTNYFENEGQKLTVAGFSVANGGNLTNCDVSIVTNNKFPYQLANGTGPKGNADMSKWSYTFNSKYANLQEGSNKITSKLTCESGAAKAYYSVNITGVKFNGTFQKPSTNLNLASQPSDTSTSLLNSSSFGNKLSNQGVDTDSLNTMDNTDIPVTNIEINSPTSGTTLNTDEPISINGTSDYPANYDCEVLLSNGNAVGVIAPASANLSNFKKTNALGINGSEDYRKWGLTLEPGTTNFKNGSESITAKLQCYSPLSSVKFAKVNVEIKSSTLAELKSMDVSIDKSGQDLNQRIIIGANDAETNEPLSGTTVTGSTNDIKFSGSTDIEGKYATSIPLDVLKSGDTISVSVIVTKDGYKLKKTSTSFEGTPLAPKDSTTTSSEPSNTDKSDNEADLADRIFDDVQKQLSDQGINIPLPFG